MARLKTLLGLFLFLSSLEYSFACGNEYYSQLNIPYKNGILDLKNLIRPNSIFLKPYWDHGFGDNVYEKLQELSKKIDPTAKGKGLKWAAIEKALENNTDYKLLSDYAWYELRVGSKKNAVRLLEKLYEKYPNEYNIAANLGTAYEVIGNNQKALMLLKKAVAINPGSHFGSEWIHINILEQKIKADPDYAAIINLGASANYPEWLRGVLYTKSITPDSLMTQIAYQLHERISFVDSPDRVVGRLVLDFADLVSITKQKNEAENFYHYARSYDQSLTDTIYNRLKASGLIKGMIPVGTVYSPTEKKKSFNWMIYTGIALVLISIAWIVSRKRKRLSSQ